MDVLIVDVNFLFQVLEDSILENQSPGSFERVNKVKADGAKHLDTVSRKLCPELHIWVTFSSVACGRGNAGKIFLKIF